MKLVIGIKTINMLTIISDNFDILNKFSVDNIDALKTGEVISTERLSLLLPGLNLENEKRYYIFNEKEHFIAVGRQEGFITIVTDFNLEKQANLLYREALSKIYEYKNAKVGVLFTGVFCFVK